MWYAYVHYACEKLQKWKKQGYKAHTFILCFLLLTSLVSVPFIKRTLLHCCTHTQRQAVFTKRLRFRFRSGVWREETKVEGLNQKLLSALPSSCATRCLHSRALRASPGINDHYGSIRAAARRSLCYTEKPGMEMLVGSHQGRDADWVRERHNTQSSSYSRCHDRQTAFQVQWVSLLSGKRMEGKND